MNIAVVTGASSGMGKEFAKEMDKLGLDEIWAIALEENMLNELQTELKTKTRIFALDLTVDDSFGVYTKALNEAMPNVTWLINCSGFGKFGRFSEIPVAATSNMIDLNCKALMKMTELTIPFMKEGARIVQFGSIAGFQPVPYISVYGATKAFVISYSRALSVELKSSKISVTTVCPYWTKTRFFKRAESTNEKVVTKFVVMYDANKVIKKAMKDATKRKKISIYGFIAKSQTFMVKYLPTSLVMNIWVNQQKFKKRYKAGKLKEVNKPASHIIDNHSDISEKEINN